MMAKEMKVSSKPDFNAQTLRIIKTKETKVLKIIFKIITSGAG